MESRRLLPLHATKNRCRTAELRYTSLTLLGAGMATYRSIRGIFARFGPFQVDLNPNKLLREGLPVPIQDKPFRVLRLLLDGEGKGGEPRAIVVR